MLMYNLLEYCSNNYSVTSGNLRNYHSDEVNDSENNDANNFRIYINKTQQEANLLSIRQN